MSTKPTIAASASKRVSQPLTNYVVVGAFAVQKNAVRFTRHVHNALHLDAKFEMNYVRNLYYVFVLNTADRSEAIAEAQRLRNESELKDAWVYSGSFSQDGHELARGSDINPITGKVMDVKTADAATESPLVISSTPVSSITKDAPSISKPSSTEASSGFDNGVEGKKFFFKITRALDQDTIQGDVDIIDIDRSKKLGTYKGNLPVKVSQPSGKSGNISLICEVFGYRKQQLDVDYNNPTTPGVSVDDGIVNVPFELVRLQKGDIAVMYNVYFFKDAAVMRPESRFEVNSLLEMLKENPKYTIKIHGHTNGGAAGKIISVEKESNNFFSLNNTKEGFGSAKKLSEERAEVIKSFLMANGIEESRMKIKAWGGKRPIHDKHSTRAHENVRVEIEILED